MPHENATQLRPRPEKISDAIEREAFSIPAPNQQTPRLVMLAQSVREMERILSTGVAKECAKICEAMQKEFGKHINADDCADAIRARFGAEK